MTGPVELTRRCPRLGGQVPFSYCEDCEEGKNPCSKLFDCWWEFFDVVAYAEKKFSAEQIQTITEPTKKPRIFTIIDLIQQAQKRVNSERQGDGESSFP